jgi:hypothetical protein
MGLASSEACFQAGTSSECLDHIQRWVTSTGRTDNSTVYSLIKTFCAGEMSKTSLDHAAHEAFMNLWVVVTGKYQSSLICN